MPEVLVSPNARLSSVARFDTVAWNKKRRVLEIWRYSSGKYSGQHDVIKRLYVPWIKNDHDLRLTVGLIANVAQLYGFSEEPNLPKSWLGYRFV